MVSVHASDDLPSKPVGYLAFLYEKTGIYNKEAGFSTSLKKYGELGWLESSWISSGNTEIAPNLIGT